MRGMIIVHQSEILARITKRRRRRRRRGAAGFDFLVRGSAGGRGRDGRRRLVPLIGSYESGDGKRVAAFSHLQDGEE